MPIAHDELAEKLNAILGRLQQRTTEVGERRQVAVVALISFCC